VIIEGLNNLPDRLATVMKNEALNVVRDAFGVVRSRYDSIDLNKIGEGLAGDPHRPELKEIVAETVGASRSQPAEGFHISNLLGRVRAKAVVLSFVLLSTRFQSHYRSLFRVPFVSFLL
jgi:hypothetical protein